MTFFIRNYGCKVSQYEGQLLREAFEAAGGLEAEGPETADLVVVNTCVVTGRAESEGLRFARRQAAAGRRVAVTGCYARWKPGAAAESAVPYSLARPEELVDWGAERGITFFAGRRRAFLKVADGCGNRCAYCLVSRIRGPLVSRPPELVRTEVDRLAAAGYREAVLCAINLGAYGIDRGSSLVELLRLLAEPAGRPGGFGLRLSSIEPDRLPSELLEMLATGRLLRRHLHLPLQSGSDRVLEAMGRRYRRAGYRELVDRARRLVPGLFLSTDVMVGFPGETGTDFEVTLDLLRELSFNRVHIFRFSPRPGTPAAERPDQVPEPVKSDRARRLKEMVRMEPVAD